MRTILGIAFGVTVVWSRRLSDDECAQMLDDPYRVFKAPKEESR